MADRSAEGLGPWVYAAVAVTLLGEGQEECRASGLGAEELVFLRSDLTRQIAELPAQHSCSWTIISVMRPVRCLFRRLTVRQCSSWMERRKPIPPLETVQWVREHRGRVGRRLYNGYAYGGSLLWWLPEEAVFIDGRMPAWHNSGDRRIFQD